MTLQQRQRQVTITYDVVPTVGAGVVLQQPRVHALPVKAVSTGDNPQLLGREGDTQPEGRDRAGQLCRQPCTGVFPWSPVGPKEPCSPWLPPSPLHL